MSDFLLRLFVKDHRNTDDPKVRGAIGTFSSFVGIAGNFLLAIIKFVAGFISSSVAIIADAFNNFSDAGSSLITFISFRISAKPADRDHPFGHARMEYISSMIVSFIILLVGFELFIDSGELLLDPSKATPLDLSAPAIIILVVSIIIKLWLGIFFRAMSRKIDSDALSATSTDCFSDTVSTGAVLLSAIVIKLTDWYILDAIVGIAVSILIIIAGTKILNDTKNALLGEAPVGELVDNIKRIVEEYPEIIGMHDLMVHNYGPKKYIASFHAEVDGSDDIYKLHDTIDNAERRLKEELGILCTIHMDPIVTNDEDTNRLKEFLEETLRDIGLEFSVHDFRVVIGETHTNLIFDVVVPFECKTSDGEICKTIECAVANKRPDHFCVITVDRG